MYCSFSYQMIIDYHGQFISFYNLWLAHSGLVSHCKEKGDKIFENVFHPERICSWVSKDTKHYVTFLLIFKFVKLGSAWHIDNNGDVTKNMALVLQCCQSLTVSW